MLFFWLFSLNAFSDDKLYKEVVAAQAGASLCKLYVDELDGTDKYKGGHLSELDLNIMANNAMMNPQNQLKKYNSLLSASDFSAMNDAVSGVAYDLGFSGQSYLRDVDIMKNILNSELMDQYFGLKPSIYDRWCTKLYVGFQNGLAKGSSAR